MSISHLPTQATGAAPLVVPHSPIPDDDIGVDPIVLRLEPLISLTPDQYFEFTQQNERVMIERLATGEIRMMSPTGGFSGNRNILIAMHVANWTESHGGIAFDSNTEFELPSGDAFAPDTSWISAARWEVLTIEQKRKFPSICPDFVIELRSDSDRLKNLQRKMQVYIDNGACLAG